MQYTIKIIISAIIIFAVSELGKKFTPVASILASLPLLSILAMIWLYNDTKDTQKIINLSKSIFLMVIPSLVFFIILPLLLKSGIKFYPAMILSCIAMFVVYTGYVFLLGKFGIKF